MRSGRRRRIGELSPPQLLALGYASIIALGAILLRLPGSTTTDITWSDALFTSVSASTVTGLVVMDTGATFTWWGEAVLLVLMQLGGLGLMTFAVMTALVLGRQVGLRQRIVLGDAFGDAPIGSVVSLVRTIVVFALAMEALGTIVLATRWVPEMGWLDGLWFSLFHTVSSFNNAGFGLRPDNLVAWQDDVVINLAVTALFIIGGIGFTVIADLRRTRTIRLLSLHTRLMLVGTLVINAIATLAFLALEYNNPATLGPLDGFDRALASWFQAVTPRTAGFNTIDTAGMEDPTVLLTIFLMFIGGGSASTASGIKLTTFIVVVLAAVAYLRGRLEARAFDRRIATETVFKALAVTVISALALMVGSFALVVIQPQPIDELLFEATSAFGTVGLSLGLTAALSEPGRVVIMALMFLGRIGPLSLVFLLARRQRSAVSYPRGEVLTG